MVFSLLRNGLGLVILICLWFVGERGTKREAGVGIGEMAAVGFFGGGEFVPWRPRVFDRNVKDVIRKYLRPFFQSW